MAKSQEIRPGPSLARRATVPADSQNHAKPFTVLVLDIPHAAIDEAFSFNAQPKAPAEHGWDCASPVACDSALNDSNLPRAV